MKFTAAIDEYLADMKAQGRINSPRTERSYFSRLAMHADDVSNRDPRATGRGDIKRTLRRWDHPNTQANVRAILVSFYDWAMEEGIRKDNPARQVRRPRKRPTSVYRLTRAEAEAMLDAAQSFQERAVVHVGLCAGLRNAEIRGLTAAHLLRPGYVHVSADIAKGARERWVPVIPDLAPFVHEALERLAPSEHLVATRRPANPPANTRWTEQRREPASSQTVRKTTMHVAKNAGIREHVHPHLLRHAFGDHVARHAGIRAAQALLGHASIDTTAGTYTGRPGLDELSTAIAFFSYRQPPRATDPENAWKATTGLEPVYPEIGPDAGESRKEAE